MKKLWTLLLGAAIMLSLTACGDGGAPKFSETTDSAKSAVTVVATNWKLDQQEYKVKKGEPFTLTLDVQEGVHGIKLEGLSGSLAGKKGSPSTKTIIANEAGSYLITCNVSCGQGHSDMKARLIVEP
ncbi:cytochrome C oxidase subunit II [Paenibacillus albiflavus]|uniref:Cytochrome C oxidase subunit II n=1 Tax=Paenibacillus albiflavus TaxID=2545760 RepID=A0A4V2WN14_9BACL|nr:cytochrome C oxidase subunit II [Paenibacillus albiflavus]TCZ73782.1 cytochrome C oxidase subunit II [Paenibacillus albiflavus]